MPATDTDRIADDLTDLDDLQDEIDELAEHVERLAGMAEDERTHKLLLVLAGRLQGMAHLARAESDRLLDAIPSDFNHRSPQ